MKRLRMRRPVLAALLAGALALAGPAAATPPGRPGPGGPPGGSPAEMIARHAQELGLDAKTQQAIQEIVASSQERDEALRTEMRAAGQHLHDLLATPDTDREAVMHQADVLGELANELHKNRLDAILRIHELLTPEQRQALVRLREQEGPPHWRRGPLGRCEADRHRLCADAGDGPAVLRCLAARWNDLSARCRSAFDDGGGAPPPP